MSTSGVGNFESERGETTFYAVLKLVSRCVQSATDYLGNLMARGVSDPATKEAVDGIVEATDNIVAMIQRGDLVRDWVVDLWVKQAKANVHALRCHIQAVAQVSLRRQ